MNKSNDYKYIIREALRNYDDIILNNSIMSYKLEYCIKEEEHSDKGAFINFYLLDENGKKQLYKSFSYEFVGYSSNNILWTWGWGIPDFPKHLLSVSRSIFNWAWDTENIDYYTKKILITSSQLIKNYIQSEIYISLALYLSHYKIAFNIKTERENGFNSDIYILNEVEGINTN
jgi:hypothetical protein